MKKLIIASILLIPFYSAADFDIKEGMALKGKIYTSKSSSKYASVEKCEAFAESKNVISPTNVEGFKYNYDVTNEPMPLGIHPKIYMNQLRKENPKMLLYMVVELMLFFIIHL